MSVVKCGSLSNAALELSLTVSPVCRMINEFESYCDKKLFNRSGKGFSLTDEGERIYNLLNPVYTELKNIEDNIHPKRKDDPKKISVYYDWSNEPIVKNLQESIFRQGNLSNFYFFNIDTRPDRLFNICYKNSICIISRDYYFNNHKRYHQCYKHDLYFISSESYVHGNIIKKLIVCEEQLYNQEINKTITRLKINNVVGEVIKVGGSETMREMILDGYGIGLVPEKFIQLKSWTGARLHTLPENEKISFDSHIYYFMDEYTFRDIDLLLKTADVN